MSDDSRIRVNRDSVDLMDFPPWKFVKAYNGMLEMCKFRLETGWKPHYHPLFGNITTIDDELGMRPWRNAARKHAARGTIAFCEVHEKWHIVGPYLLQLTFQPPELGWIENDGEEWDW